MTAALLGSRVSIGSGASIPAVAQVALDGSPTYADGAVAHVPIRSYFLGTGGQIQAYDSTADMTVNGTTPVPFYAEAAATGPMFVERLTLSMTAASSMGSTAFINQSSLTNGLSIDVYDPTTSTVVTLLATGLANNLEVRRRFFSTWNQLIISGSDSSVIAACYPRELGGPLIIPAGHRLRVIVNDNLSAYPGTVSLGCNALLRQL